MNQQEKEQLYNIKHELDDNVSALQDALTTAKEYMHPEGIIEGITMVRMQAMIVDNLTQQMITFVTDHYDEMVGEYEAYVRATPGGTTQR